MLTYTCKYANRRAITVCWQSWPPIQMVSWNDSGQCHAQKSPNLSTRRGGSSTDGSFLSATARRTVSLPVAMQWYFARQSYPGSGSKQSPSVSTFPTVGVICIIKAEGRPYTSSGKQYLSTEYKSSKNCRYFPESQTYGIFQDTHIFNWKNHDSTQIIPEVCASYRFIPAGEQRLLQYSDYRAGEINWTN